MEDDVPLLISDGGDGTSPVQCISQESLGDRRVKVTYVKLNEGQALSVCDLLEPVYNSKGVEPL